MPYLVLAAALAPCRSARAGFTLVTDTFSVSIYSPDAPGVPSEGASFGLGGGHFTDYRPDSPADPTISPLELSRLQFGGMGILSSYDGQWQEVGAFSLVYDDGSGNLAGMIDVGALNLFGTFDAAAPSPVTGRATLFGYTNSPVLQAIDAGRDLYFDGVYTPGPPGAGTSTMQGVFRTRRDTPTAIPEPGSLALMGAGLAGALFRLARRMNSRATKS